MTTSEGELERRRKQRELDSVLDAALDALDDDDSDGDVDVDGVGHASHDAENSRDGGGRRQTADHGGGDGVPRMGVPYSLEYLETNRNAREEGDGPNDASKGGRTRPRFGPAPPPPPLPLPDLPPGEAEELAASLEEMMKQFTEELGDGGEGGAALDDAFRKMMLGDGGGGGNERRSDPRTTGNGDAPSPRSDAAAPGQKSDGAATKEDNTAADAGGGDVDESINRLLDGINRAAADPLPNMNPPGMENVDPAQFQKMGEEMMENIMGEFDKMGGADDGDAVVDGVMKQLLSKDLMYEPMREVCLRFPKWLAEKQEELSEQEYERYGSQYQYFQKIVRVYETEPDNFARLMELMQDVQEYGQPPVDIIRDLAPELEFDAEGTPVMMGPGEGGTIPGMMPPGMGFPGGAGEQCCIS